MNRMRAPGTPATPRRPRPPRAAAFLLGVGLGGFVDGIVLHQLLQWHHMLSDTPEAPLTTLEGLRTNTTADGLFHVATWVFVVLGTLLLVVAWRRHGAAPTWGDHTGGMLVGWGVFDVVEGLVDHQVLGIHHVRDDLGAPLAWDIGFLLFGVALVVGGLALQRLSTGDRRITASPARSASPATRRETDG
jgi:uncharacterized membrane protein